MTSSYFARGAHSEFEPNVVCDITDTFDAKCNALREYASQRAEELIDDVRAQNRLWGLRTGVRYAEPFREYPLFGRTAAARRGSLRDLVI